MTRTAAGWEALADTLAGDVVLPGSPGYDAARKPAMALFHDVRPQAVVRCATAADVGETLAYARRSGLPTAIRSGGHCFAGRSSTEGIVIDVSPMASVRVADGLATVGAGTRLGDLYDGLAEHGRTVAAGCGPSVGIAGLTLGGGVGLLGRSAGLTSDQLVRAEVVLAGGEVVECDEQRDADLFWALRGAGGGTLGVVTSLVLRTLAEPAATSFRLTWPHAHAPSVIAAWQVWAPDGPDKLAASLLVTAAGDVTRPPIVTVVGTMLAGTSETEAQLSGLVARVGADPVSASSRHASYRAVKRDLAEVDDDGERAGEAIAYSKSEFFGRPLPAGAIAALVEHLAAGRVEGQARELDFTPWGGAYNRVPAGATAFVHRDERFLLKHGVELDPRASSAEREAARRWLRRSFELLGPWGTGRAYPNFPDPDHADWAAAAYGANRSRVLRIRARYAPPAPAR